jgi:hypothetical protein
MHDTAAALQNGVYQRKLLQTTCCDKRSLQQGKKWWGTFINGSATFMVMLQSIRALYVTGQKRAMDGEFLDVLHQPEMWWSVFGDCEGVILLDVTQRGMTIKSGMYISILKKMKKCFQCVQPDKNLCDILLQHNARPHTSITTREAITQLGWTVLSHPP